MRPGRERDDGRPDTAGVIALVRTDPRGMPLINQRRNSTVLFKNDPIARVGGSIKSLFPTRHE
jgi:hypothetical protein